SRHPAHRSGPPSGGPRSQRRPINDSFGAETGGAEIELDIRLRLDHRQDPDATPIRDLEPLAQLRHLAPDRLGLAPAEVGAPAVEPLVARQELGPVASEVLEEVLASARPEVEQARPDR